MTAMTGANGRHARFRELAATALDFSLSRTEAAELEAHLAGCPACARLAGSLRFDATVLRRPAELPTSYRLDTAIGAAIAGRPPRPSPGRTLLLVAATALLLVALLGAAAVGAFLWRTLQPPLLVVNPSPQPSGEPAPSGVPGPTSKPGPTVPALTWDIGAIPPMVGDGQPLPAAVAGGDGGFVAVGGRVFRDNQAPGGGTASAWRSDDGLAWAPATADDGLALGDDIPVDDEPMPGFGDVAWGPAGYVAVGIDFADGSSDRVGAAWHSNDGAGWDRVELPGAAQVRPAAVAWNGSAYVMVGVVREDGAPRAAAWLSGDGRSWRRVADGDAFDIGGYIQYYSASGTGGLADVVAAEDGSLVAVGHTCAGTTSPEEQAVCTPIVLRSVDGESWTVVAGDAATGIGLSSVAVKDGRFVAVAGGPGALQRVQAPGQVRLDGTVARVAIGDAAGWRLVDLPGVPPLDRIVTLGDWFLAVSSAGNRISLWSSPDGETWTEVPGVLQPQVSADQDPEMQAFADVDLAVTGSGVVITGQNQAADKGPEAFSLVGSPTTASAPSPGPSATPSAGPGPGAEGPTSVSVGPSGAAVAALGERPPALDEHGDVVAFEAGSLGGGSAVLVRDVGSSTTVAADVTVDGGAAADTAWRPSISADGRYVAFDSWSANLVAADTNEAQDVFVRDLTAGTTVRVSVASDGSQAATGGWLAALSSDGSTVAFAATSPDLVADDTNERSDIFVHDLVTGETARVSVGPGGRQANGDSTQPALSADGRVIAFYSAATNLVRGDTNGVVDLFVHDRDTGTTTRVSVASDGTQGDGGAGPATSCVTGSTGPPTCSVGTPPSLSGDGRLVVFASDATNLVPRDRNASADVFLHDRATGETSLLSRRSDGTQADAMSYEPVISADGAVVAFTSGATNLVEGVASGELGDGVADVYVLDRRTGDLARASSDPDGRAVGGSRPSLSRDGRVVAFLTADDVPGIVLLTLPVGGR